MNPKEKLKQLYHEVYGNHSDVHTSYANLLDIIQRHINHRRQELVSLDQLHKDWYFQSDLIGMTLYVDLFSGTLKNLATKIDYFKELGVNMIHLMPLLRSRDGENDGGYAVMDYRDIDPKLGSMDDFISLLNTLRSNHIYVCIDYVINHVAKEHEWAKKALQGDPFYQDMFIMFDTDEIPNQFNLTVPEVLPDKCPGNFTFDSEIKKYVFTSFSDFQWDLNFANPHVFNGMADNMLYLANLGINMIRLDAIPFMWKQLGTSCRNLPTIHLLLEMLHLIKEEVCPSVSLLGEAIVEPFEIVKYFGTSEKPECEIMYNANLMVNIFNSFATRDTRLLAMDTNLHHIPQSGSWMNYIRCHDDIGWGFNEKANESLGFSSDMHKQFLIQFYGGKFPGSFASGHDYQYNPITHDARTNGTLASLLGLEKALKENHEQQRISALKRINLAHSIILFHRGFPLIYSGDEIATLNDYTYVQDAHKANESRWMHRPHYDWKRSLKRHQPGTDEYVVFQALKQMINIRKNRPHFDGRDIQYALDIQNQAVLCLVRRHQEDVFIGLFNVSEHPQYVSLDIIRQHSSALNYIDHISLLELDFSDPQLLIEPYQSLWCFPAVLQD